MNSQPKNRLTKLVAKLFRMFFVKDRNLVEVGVIGSTAFIIVIAIILSVIGFDLKPFESQVALIAMAILGYIAFVEIHERW